MVVFVLSQPCPWLLSVMRTPVELQPSSKDRSAPWQVGVVSSKQDRSKIGSRRSPRMREKRRRLSRLAQRKTSCFARRDRLTPRPALRSGSIRLACSRRNNVKDYQASIEKLRKDAAEAALIRDSAMDEAKREVFNRLWEHLNRLADE